MNDPGTTSGAQTAGATSTSASSPTSIRPSLLEVATVFLRLGCTAFGGPAAHVAMMEREVVRRHRWVTHEQFLDLLGAANLIPGPSSSELAIYLGYERRGLPGLLVAGACFILPATGMTAAIAWAYVRFGALPQTASVLYGIKPVIIAIVAQALWTLAPKAAKTRKLALVGAAALAAAASGVEPILALLAAGALSVAIHAAWRRPPGAGVAMLGVAVPFAPSAATLPALFLFFLKAGAVVFGSGYVLLAFLHDDLVVQRHWLSETQLLDAIVVGQLTPGPLFTTATFIGYLLGGASGAVVATFAIFLPGFVLVAFTRPLLTRVRRSKTASAFIDGVNVASLALMALVTIQLGRSAVIDLPTAGIALASLAALIRFELNSAWLIAAGAAAGALAAAVR